MFSPEKLTRFLSRFLMVLLPILALLFAMSIATEWIGGKATLLAVIRDMAPGLLALAAVDLMAARFVQALYKIKSLAEARGFMYRCLFGLSKFGPWLRIEAGKANQEDHILNQAGGPGHLVVYNDSAVLLEKSGQFTRIAKKGFVRLDPLEKAYTIVDLRPKRWVYPVKAMSKEGIPITCDAEIAYQIDDEGLESSEKEPYPAPEHKIFQAAVCTWIREADRPVETRTMDWSGRVIISETEGSLRTILSQYPLDRLIGLAPDSINPREEIRSELEKQLRKGVPKLGAKILSVALGDIKVDHEITQQWVEAWQARWERWATERQALGKAAQVEQVEHAKTRAQVMMITNIIEALQPLATPSDQAITSKLVLTRLFMVLSRAQADPLTRVYLPQEAVNTLRLLKRLIV
ncbi:MAG: SPFH domain-containing protein [Anaerolineae bacterium]|nr:SPFH domain-containing protein [Anaerolineae bacterium]